MNVAELQEQFKSLAAEITAFNDAETGKSQFDWSDKKRIEILTIFSDGVVKHSLKVVSFWVHINIESESLEELISKARIAFDTYFRVVENP